MTIKRTIRALLAEAGKPARLKEARAAWVRQTAAALRDAQRRMDERLDEAVNRVSEEEFERLCDEEEAKVDVFHEPMKLAAEKDLWPRSLYSGGI